jgi:predicted transcriptional regulator
MRNLGELEAAVMDVLWRGDQPMSVRAVHSELAAHRDLAYTTVLTVLDNLHRKGFAQRELQGRAYQYRAAMPRGEMLAAGMRELLEGADDSEAVLLYFARSVSDSQVEILRAALDERQDRS